MKTNLSTTPGRAIALGFLFTPVLAQAHPGHSTGLISGVIHPFSGLDHLAAMVATGLWAAQLGGRARFFVPLAFIVAMSIGGMVGVSGLAVPGLDQGIAASVFILGLLVVTARRLSMPAAMVLVSGFALFHGAAHLSEMPMGANSAAYAVGLALSSAVLQAMGLAIGSLAMRTSQHGWVRLGGAATVLAAVLDLHS